VKIGRQAKKRLAEGAGLLGECPTRFCLLLALAFAAQLSSACATSEEAKVERAQKVQKAGFDSGMPSMKTGMPVERVVERGGYLEAHLLLGKTPLAAYTAPTENCRAVFVEGDVVTYVDNGPRGVYRRGELECQSLGFGNLALWRDRSSRSTRSGAVIPREPAWFKVTHEDDEVIYLQGSFPLASRFGFTEPRDLTAILPNVSICQGAIEGGNSSMEYRSKGAQAYTLTGPNGLCVIEGFAAPLRSAPPAPASEP
jgi:hypothetical protein